MVLKNTLLYLCRVREWGGQHSEEGVDRQHSEEGNGVDSTQRKGMGSTTHRGREWGGQHTEEGNVQHTEEGNGATGMR